MGWLSKIKADAEAAIAAEKEGKPYVIANKQVIVIEPVDIEQAIEYLGLPGGTSLRGDDCSYDMWLPKTGLKENEGRNYYCGELRNEGKTAAFYIEGKRIGNLEDTALPEAVEALKAYGGRVAPAVLKITREGSRTDGVIVGKRGWHWKS